MPTALTCIETTLHDFDARNPGDDQFHAVARDLLYSIEPLLEQHAEFADPGLLAALCEPDRQVLFRVLWEDDRGMVRVNRGFRVQFSNLLGPYKGGLRFDPGVNLDLMQSLAFEQVFKSALTGLGIGGAKGGSDFDPRGRSDREVQRFCQAFVEGLAPYIGPERDVPAGDIGVGRREIGYLLGAYRRHTGRDVPGAFTGKAPEWGGSQVRAEATGYGVGYFAREMLRIRGDELAGKRCVVSGAGAVALNTIEKLHQLDAVVVACSDSDGYVLDEDGIDLDLLREVKVVEGGRVSEYAARRSSAGHRVDGSIWDVPCDIAVPAATQNELDDDDAATLIGNGCVAVVEAANMPVTPEAVTVLRASGVPLGAGKAANAGGVATSALEMQQNASRETWTFEEVEARLEGIMVDIHATCCETAERFGSPGDYTRGANIAGFERVARTALALGLA